MIYHLDTDMFTLAYYRKASVVEQIEKHRISDSVEISIATRLEVLKGRIASVITATDASQSSRALDVFAKSEKSLSAFPIALYNDDAGHVFDTVLAEKKIKKLASSTGSSPASPLRTMPRSSPGTLKTSPSCRD